MDRIPVKFYPIIHQELEKENVKKEDIPDLLTSEYLAPYGGMGSYINPFVYLKIPEDMLIQYGSIFFTPSKMPCIPQKNLYNERIYLISEGVYRPVAKFVEDERIGIRTEPFFQNETRFHSYINIMIQITHRENTNIIEFINHGKEKKYFHINEAGTAVITPLTIDTQLCTIREQLRQLDLCYSRLDADIEQLDAHETLYFGHLIKHPTLRCPYKHLSDLRMNVYTAQQHLRDITAKLDTALELGDNRDEGELIQIVQKIGGIDTHRIIKVIEQQYWNLLQYLMASRSFTEDIRKAILSDLLQNGPHLLKTIPEHIFFQLYNWRESGLTSCIIQTLRNQGCNHLAHRLKTMPFKPSPLNHTIL